MARPNGSNAVRLAYARTLNAPGQGLSTEIYNVELRLCHTCEQRRERQAAAAEDPHGKSKDHEKLQRETLKAYYTLKSELVDAQSTTFFGSAQSSSSTATARTRRSMASDRPRGGRRAVISSQRKRKSENCGGRARSVFSSHGKTRGENRELRTGPRSQPEKATRQRTGAAVDAQRRKKLIATPKNPVLSPPKRRP